MSSMTATTDDLTAKLKLGRAAAFDWAGQDATVEQLAQTLTAMANTRAGGTLILGVEGDAGELRGVEDVAASIDRTLEALLRVQPRLIVPMPQAVTLADKTLIVVTIPSGMPQVYALDGRYLRREGARNVPLDPRELRRLLMERGDIPFETEIARGATRDDLDWLKAKAYALRLGVPDVEALLVKRGCAVRVDGQLLPTHAGLLLFGMDVGAHVRGAEITAVRFTGQTMGDHFKRQDIGGTLPDQIRQAELFLRDHLRKEVTLNDSMARREHYEYPLEAVRELVVNAVAHRDYSIAGDGIRLYLFTDHLELTSPGLLPGPVTVNNIKDERFSRNPIIVQVLADMGFIERLGYGIDRVLELMRAQGLPAPSFTETGGGLRVTLHKALQDSPQTAAPDERPTEPTPPPALHAAVKAEAVTLPDAYRDVPLNPRQEAALAFLLGGGTRITNSELQRMFSDVHAETIRRDLSDLVTKKILAKMGEKRGAYYVLKRADDHAAEDDSSKGDT
jgi:ATP-dependent DNA helicase RecG